MMRFLAVLICSLQLAAPVRAAMPDWDGLHGRTRDLYRSGRLLDARGIAFGALAAAERTFGKDHVNYAQSQMDLGRILLGLGMYSQALQMFESSLPVLRGALSASHPEIVRNVFAQAEARRSLNDHAGAEPLYYEALASVETSAGTRTADAAVIHGGLGVLYREQGLKEKALERHELALNILEETAGKNSPEVSRALNDVAEDLLVSQDYKAAEKHLRRARKIDLKQSDREHPGIAATLDNLGEVLRLRGKYKDAPVLLGEAYTILAKAWGPGHPAVQATVERLCELLKAPDPKARSQAVAALGLVAGYDYTTIRKISEAVDDENQNVANNAAAVIRNFVETKKDLRTRFFDMLKKDLMSQDVLVRLSAARTLWAVGPAANPLAGVLGQARQDPDVRVRDYAVKALGRLSE